MSQRYSLPEKVAEARARAEEEVLEAARVAEEVAVGEAAREVAEKEVMGATRGEVETRRLPQPTTEETTAIRDLIRCPAEPESTFSHGCLDCLGMSCALKGPGGDPSPVEGAEGSRTAGRVRPEGVAIIWRGGAVDPSPEDDTSAGHLEGRPSVLPRDIGFRDPLPEQVRNLAATSKRWFV